MRIEHPIIALCAVAFGLWSSTAHAQSATAAEALYEDGQRLLKAGDVHGACLKFQESQRVDPGIGTLINLASCHEKENKTATAWSEFTDAASQAQRAGQHDREQFAKGKADALEKGLFRLVLDVAKPVPQMVIRLDGEAFGQGALGTPIPLDPGEHTILVTAPGKKPWTQQVKMGPGAVKEHIEVPELEDAAAEAPAAPAAASAPSSPHAAADAGAPPSSPRKIAAYAIGGAGIAGLGVGVTLVVRSVLYSGKASDENNQLLTITSPVDRTTFTAAAKSDGDAASANRTGGIIACAAGGVAIGASIYLLVTAGGGKSVEGHAAADGSPLRTGFFLPRAGASSAPTSVGYAW